MTAQTLTATTCTATAGEGLVTTWLLSGLTTTYTAATGVNADTDGYKIAAAMTWQSWTSKTTDPIATSNEAATSGTTSVVIGTCVETLDSASAALATTVTTEGNFAICHWMFAVYGNDTAVTTLSATTNGWGDTKYLTTSQWGTSGNAVTGAGATSTGGGGTSLTSANNGLEFSPAVAASLTLSAQAYTMTWYQPKYASTYGSSALRRYNGGTSDADKVKAYCVSTRIVTVTSHVTAGFVAGSAVTLSGAAALTAGVATLLGSTVFIF